MTETMHIINDFSDIIDEAMSFSSNEGEIYPYLQNEITR